MVNYNSINNHYLNSKIFYDNLSHFMQILINSIIRYYNIKKMKNSNIRSYFHKKVLNLIIN